MDLKPKVGSNQFVFASILAILVFVPPFLGAYYKVLLTEIMIWGLFALSFDIIYGYTGMLSFGHALFFGVGAYSVAISVTRWDVNLWSAILFAMFVAMVFAWVVGFLSIRVIGAYFVIITIIFSLVFFFLSLNWKWLTGGEDGLSFSPPPISLGVIDLSFRHPLNSYYFVLIFVVASYLVCRKVINSPLGRIFEIIRENEDRARLIGYKVERFKLISFIIAGIFAGLSGALFAITSRFANVEFLYWTISGDAVVWTVIGGAGTLIGPMLGTGLMIIFTDYISSWFKNYPMLVGGLLILVILTSPKGIMGLLSMGIERWKR
ncbi:MAG: branched-chain amino acid ABC transporter permease [Proteobacteria bacterium]|nr:branched-chain amino acid ABC transporter permease [Pseudomonadota bacterium]